MTKRRPVNRPSTSQNNAQRKQFWMAFVVGLVVITIGGGGIFLASINASKSNESTDAANDTTIKPKSSKPQAATPKPVPVGKAVTGDTPCPPIDRSGDRYSKFEKAPNMCIDPKKKYTAEFDTSEGKVVVDLDTEKTPQTTNNFVVLSRYKYYDDSAIFRTDTSIDIIQGGGPTSQSASDPGPGYTIKDEGGKFTYSEGDLVMARAASPDSASAQYFFVTGPKASALDSQGTYVVFGHTTQGLDVLKKIIGMNVQDPSTGMGGYPSKVVTVNKITITEH